MKPKIYVTREIPKVGIYKLKEAFEVFLNPEDRVLTKEEIIQNIQDKDALLCLLTDQIDAEVIEAGKHLKVISNYAVGFNNIDIKTATRKGIPVCITPGILTNATADLTFALILAIARRIVEADNYTRKGSFTGWAPNLFLGSDLTDKTLGIIGMGRIGMAVAKRAKGFGMKVIYHSRHSKETELGDFTTLETLLKEADFISLHTPLTPDTHHLIGLEQFKMMKKTAYLINTTRGPVIDEKALIYALKNNLIQGAGLDVYEEEPQLMPGLASLENVVLLPHIGSATIETRSKMALIAAENVINVFNGHTPQAIVNAEVLKH